MLQQLNWAQLGAVGLDVNTQCLPPAYSGIGGACIFEHYLNYTLTDVCHYLLHTDLTHPLAGGLHWPRPLCENRFLSVFRHTFPRQISVFFCIVYFWRRPTPYLVISAYVSLFWNIEFGVLPILVSPWINICSMCATTEVAFFFYRCKWFWHYSVTFVSVSMMFREVKKCLSRGTVHFPLRSNELLYFDRPNFWEG